MKATFVELTAFEAILPLASGYMQAYASQDPEIRDSWSFEIYSKSVETDRDRVLAELLARPSDVYAISCYIWNMALVHWLVERLVAASPSATFLLGGPQVMNHAHEYVPPGRENVVVCNGEGEKTFHELLRQLGAERDLAAVPGLSFRSGDELVTTEAAPRIRDLTEVPSPFAAGVFERGRFTTAILETNRGCPFRCAFCYWGAATNDRVNKFEEERLRSDIEWIAQNGFVSLFIIDANWGMLRRDIELTDHIVACARQHGYPLMVAMASAKNSPEKVARITESLVAGGLLTSQPISLQTMSRRTLELIDRANIKHSAYESLQQTLKEKGISSYIELIWPLPGETIESYREGIGALCRAQADTIIVYPQLLLHNTPIYRNRDELGIRVRRVPSDVAEADVVVATNWADEATYEEGVWFYYALHSLYNLRGLGHVLEYLEASGLSPFEETLAAAARFFQRGDDPISRFFATSVSELRNYDFHNYGLVAHLTLHEHREVFDELLLRFVSSLPCWSEPAVKAAFELDLLSRPYIYAEPVRLPTYPFEHLAIEPVSDWAVEVEGRGRALEELVAAGVVPPGGAYLVEHSPARKMPFMAQAPLDHNASYCQGMILRMRELVPAIAERAGVPR